MKGLDAKLYEITSQLQCTCSTNTNHEGEANASNTVIPYSMKKSGRPGPSQAYRGDPDRRVRLRAGGSAAKKRLIAGRTRGVSGAALRAIRARL